MSDTHASSDTRRELGQYEIRLKGHLESRWAAWFDGLSLTPESDGTTVIRGSVIDQAALHGLLCKVRDLGLPLIAVTQIEPKQIKWREKRKSQPRTSSDSLWSERREPVTQRVPARERAQFSATPAG